MSRQQLHALSPAEGRTRWSVGWNIDEFNQRLCLQRNLGIDDDHLYIAGCDGVRALRRSGGEREWLTETRLRSGVAVGADRVYANGDDLLAINTTSGNVIWRAQTGGERLTRPAVASETIVHTDRANGVVTAFNADGERQWQHRTEVETRSPTITNDTVYIATANDPDQEGKLLALNRETGSVQWRADTTGTVKRGTRPIVGDSRVFIGCSGTDTGRLVAFTISEGTKEWTFTDENSTVYEPVLVDDRIYVGSNDNHLYALNRAGQPQWEFEMNRTVGPVVADDSFVFASDGSLAGLSRS